MDKLSICKEVLQELSDLIDSPELKENFCEKNRFIRKRKLSLKQLICYFFYTSHASMNLNLANIIEDLPEIEFPVISKQAVSKARMAISPALFEKLLQVSVEKFYHSDYSRKTWHGFYVFAIDGSTIQVPKTNDTIEYFGLCHNQYHSREDAMACISTLYDVLEDIIIDGIIQKYHTAERSMAKEHLSCLESFGLSQNTVVTFDRGYPSFDFYRYFNEKQYYYVMRVQGKIKSLTQLGSKDAITDFRPMDRKTEEPVTVRVLHVTLDDGTDECLVTNILDSSITVEMFKELYFLRWGIESKYNELKNQLELEEFSGSSHISVEQDFFIKLLFMNICSLIKACADDRISEVTNSSNKYHYQANRAFLIGRLQKHLARLLSGFKDIDQWINTLFEQAVKRRSQIQPNRKCKRPKIQLRRRHCKNRKTTT